MNTNDKSSKNKKELLVLKIGLAVVWICIIAFFMLHKNDISVSDIIKYTPRSKPKAAFALLIMFAVKSVSIVIYNGILYAAAGVIFSLPEAVAVNIAGTAVMVTIPYFIGKLTGSSAAEQIVNKYSGARQLKELREENDFMFTFLTRVVGGFLPCDIVSLYMGAAGVKYKSYLAGCILGMLPGTILLPLIGMNIKNPKSPAFFAAVAVQLLWMALSVVIYRVYKKRKK